MVLYWDRLAGVPVDLFIEEVDIGEEYLSYSVRLIELDVWAIPEFPTWPSMLLALVVLAVAIVTYKRRLLNTPSR